MLALARLCRSLSIPGTCRVGAEEHNHLDCTDAQKTKLANAREPQRITAMEKQENRNGTPSRDMFFAAQGSLHGNTCLQSGTDRLWHQRGIVDTQCDKKAMLAQDLFDICFYWH